MPEHIVVPEFSVIDPSSLSLADLEKLMDKPALADALEEVLASCRTERPWASFSNNL